MMIRLTYQLIEGHGVEAQVQDLKVREGGTDAPPVLPVHSHCLIAHSYSTRLNPLRPQLKCSVQHNCKQQRVCRHTQQLRYAPCSCLCTFTALLFAARGCALSAPYWLHQGCFCIFCITSRCCCADPACAWGSFCAYRRSIWRTVQHPCTVHPYAPTAFLICRRPCDSMTWTHAEQSLNCQLKLPYNGNVKQRKVHLIGTFSQHSQLFAWVLFRLQRC